MIDKTMDMADTSSTQQVKVLFQASKWGFGPFEVVEDSPESKMAAASYASRRRGCHKVDHKQQSLGQQDDFITRLNYLPPQLNGVVSEKEYLDKMTQLQSVLATHTGPKIPLLIALAYLVAGVVIDIIWEWYGFFMIVLPVISFVISFYIMNSRYKGSVKDVFRSWTDVEATFTNNVIKGNYALLELKVMDIPRASVVTIEYGGSMESEIDHEANKGTESV